MASPQSFRTPYDRRVELVSHAIKDNSKLSGSAADELAVHVLRALNSIPEQMR